MLLSLEPGGLEKEEVLVPDSPELFGADRLQQDVREMRQPVYCFRPKLGFGLLEKKFDQTATRWSFD